MSKLQAPLQSESSSPDTEMVPLKTAGNPKEGKELTQKRGRRLSTRVPSCFQVGITRSVKKAVCENFSVFAIYAFFWDSSAFSK